MEQRYTIEKCDNYIHVKLEGDQSTAKFAREVWGEVVKACQAHSCFNILGESFLELPQDPADAFAQTTIFPEVGMTLQHRLAWVTHKKTVAHKARLVEAALKSRGLVNGHLFKTVEEARAWLLSPEPNDD